MQKHSFLAAGAAGLENNNKPRKRGDKEIQMNATTMLQVVANILATPIENLDLTGSQAYRNGYDQDMDVGHDVDVLVNDVNKQFSTTLQNLKTKYPNLELSWVDKGWYDHCAIYMGVCGFQVNLIDLGPVDFRAWRAATALVKAEWAGRLEMWEKEARVAFFKAARNAYVAGHAAGRQGW